MFSKIEAAIRSMVVWPPLNWKVGCSTIECTTVALLEQERSPQPP